MIMRLGAVLGVLSFLAAVAEADDQAAPDSGQIGDGGWLIGDGADPGDGGAGGAVFGDGGDGGNGGLLGGNGGDGGDGGNGSDAGNGGQPTPDGETPADEAGCDAYSDSAFGWCTTACEALDCDTPDASAQVACAVLADAFFAATQEELPCLLGE